MKLIKFEKGTSYDAVEMDLAAVMSGKYGDNFLDKDNCLKSDTEIHFIRKRYTPQR